MRSLPKRDMYAMGSFRSTPQTIFIETCLNELSLPHAFSSIDRDPKGSIESVIMQSNLGGAYVNPPIARTTSYIPEVSDAARAIGLVYAIVVAGSNGRQSFMGENAVWKGIRATLTRDSGPDEWDAQRRPTGGSHRMAYGMEGVNAWTTRRTRHSGYCWDRMCRLILSGWLLAERCSSGI